MAQPATLQRQRASRPVLFSSFGNMEHVLHDADRLVPILFKGQDISFLPIIKETVREHTQEFKWKSIILNISKGMARKEMDTFINLSPPHIGPVVVDATARSPDHEVIYEDAILRAKKERIIRLNDSTKDAMFLLYGIHSLPTPLQLNLGMARFYYMGVTIDRLLELEMDIDAYTDEPSYRSGLKKALGAARAAHNIYDNDSPFTETHINESARRLEMQSWSVFTGLATAYAATQIPEVKAQIGSMIDEMKANPEIYKNVDGTPRHVNTVADNARTKTPLAPDGKPQHVNTIAENAIPPKDLLNEVASDPAALIAAQNDPLATAYLLNSPATADAIHRSPYLTDALEDNTETQNLLRINPVNDRRHNFESEETPQQHAQHAQPQPQSMQPQPVQQQQAQASAQPAMQEAPRTEQRQTEQRRTEQPHTEQPHTEQPHTEYPPIPLLHETNRYSEIKAITNLDEPVKDINPAETAQAITTQTVAADTARHTQPAAQPDAQQAEHYESYTREHEAELPRPTRTIENAAGEIRRDSDSITERAGNESITDRAGRTTNPDNDSIADRAGDESISDNAGRIRTDTPRETIRETRAQSHIESAPAEQAQAVDDARYQERLEPAQQSQGIEQPERIARVRAAEHVEDQARHTREHPYDSQERYIDQNINERRDPRNSETRQEIREEAREETREVPRETQTEQPRAKPEARPEARPETRGEERIIEQQRDARQDATRENQRAMHETTRQEIQRQNAETQRLEREQLQQRAQNNQNPDHQFKEGYDETSYVLEQAFDGVNEHAKKTAENIDAIQENAQLNEEERQIAAQDNAERNRMARMNNVAEREAIDLANAGFVNSSTTKPAKKDDKKKKAEDEPQPHHPDDTPKPEPT